MKTTNLIPPNTEYLELNFVGETATGRGNNQQYVMENLHDGTFRVMYETIGDNKDPQTLVDERKKAAITELEKQLAKIK